MNDDSFNAYYLEDLSVGMTESVVKTVEDSDIAAFTQVSGDRNPVHHDDDYASGTMFKKRIAHGMLTASLFSSVLGTKLPGHGSIYLSQTLKFKAPVYIGETVTATCTITAIDEKRRRVTLACECIGDGKVVVEGEASVMVPKRGAES